jgi:alkanesulfonate monooxygenase SsuD/methylene tetrahydromethanopterin reductase-like flavin-dependent oxidoreductase (luciferase family)
MRFGWVLPYGNARTVAELAPLAEEAGWDGFFVWDAVWGMDAWALLAAAALRTERIRLGTMLTPVPRRKPWDLASSVATVDELSGGRVILAAGLGAPGDRFWLFEEDPGRRVRAERMDESFELMERLWSGEAFTYHGTHFRTEHEVPAEPDPPAVLPVQRPRPTTWVVGVWPVPRSMRRVARFDGWLPNYRGADGSAGSATPEALREGVAWLGERRSLDGFDIVAEGTTPPDPEEAGKLVKPWVDAGATWWIDADWSEMDADRVRIAAEKRLSAGPPRLP